MAACASSPAPPLPFTPPAFLLDQGFDPTAGVIGAPIAVDGGQEGAPAPLRIRFIYLEEAPSASQRALTSAVSEATVVADMIGGAPIAGTPQLTTSFLLAQGLAAEEWTAEALGSDDHAVVLDERILLVPGATYRLGLTSSAFVEDPRDWLDEFPDRGPIPRRVGVTVTSSVEGVAVAVEVTDLDPEKEAALVEDVLEHPDVLPGPPRPGQDEVLRRESLTISAHPTAGSPLVIQLDSPFETGTGSKGGDRICGIVIEVVDASAVDQTVLEAQRLIDTAADKRSRRAVPLTDESRADLQRAEALREFQSRGGRPALLLLAEEANAELAAELALVADESFLVELSRSAFPGAEETPEGETIVQQGDSAVIDPAEHPASTTINPKSIRWVLESSAWQLLATGSLDETLDPELDGVLLRRGGALARFPDVIIDALKASKPSLEAFDARMIIEHEYSLEDSSASVRVRAFDWLTERGRAPEGYDPLGPREERRAALAAAREAAPTQEVRSDG